MLKYTDELRNSKLKNPNHRSRQLSIQNFKIQNRRAESPRIIPNSKFLTPNCRRQQFLTHNCHRQQLLTAAGTAANIVFQKFNENVCFSEKFTPLKRYFRHFKHHEHYCFSAQLVGFYTKTIGFTSLFLSFHAANRQPLPTKTIGIAMQNDRFCTHRPLRKTAHRRPKQHNSRYINALRLHTHTAQKTDRQIVFFVFRALSEGKYREF